MAGKKENLKALFSNTRTRVIIVFTAVLLILAIVIGYFKFRTSTSSPLASAEITSAPSIQSIPGSQNPIAQYAKLQETQNITQAEQALKSGKSAIPTLVRTQAIGEGVGTIGSPEGKAGVGFKTLAQAQSEGLQQSLWIQTLQNSGCSASGIKTFLDQGGQFKDLKSGCTCVQLKNNGYDLSKLRPICDCKELKEAGFLAKDLKIAGFTAGQLRSCGFNACEERNAGFSAEEMKDGGFSDGELKGSGFPEEEIAKASGLPTTISAKEVRTAGCDVGALTKLKQSGVSAAAIKRISGCPIEQLKAAGFTAKELREAGFSAADLKRAGFTPDAIQAAGFSTKELEDASLIPSAVGAKNKVPDCSPEALKKARTDGVSALTIKQTLGCSAKALKDAGYSAKELMNAGFTAAELQRTPLSPKELKDAGFSAKELYNAGLPLQDLKNLGYGLKDLKDAGISPAELKGLGFTPVELKAAGVDAKALRAAGFSAQELARAGFSPRELKDLFSVNELKNAGFTPKELKDAGFTEAEAGLSAPTKPAETAQKSALAAEAAQNAANNRQLQAVLDKQNQQLAEQKYQQKIQQKTSEMLTAANLFIQDWKKIAPHVYVPGLEEKPIREGTVISPVPGIMGSGTLPPGPPVPLEPGPAGPPAAIKTGDVLFAVLDTSVNSDEPGPILATIVSGRLRGSKLIGSFNLPPNANKMVISFNTLSIPGALKSISISAFAIDPNTGRTALSSITNHHYLMRYGSLFASAFLEGFGNAFQASNTSITIGGTGGGNNITVQSGVGQSALASAVIGLATVGKMWGQQAQLVMNTPTTVMVCAGTGLGILFTQDVTLL